MEQLLGTYGGIVERNADPEKLGRCKVRVPHVYGISGASNGYIGVNDLPWAMPAGMPAGGSAQSGGFSMIPDVGDKVWVRFLDGEPEKPVYEWGMQSFGDRDGLKLHKYQETGGVIGKPNAMRLTRYGHTMQIDDAGIAITTSQGYALSLNDGSEVPDGESKLSTSLGGFISVQDDGVGSYAWLNVSDDFNCIVGDEYIGTARSYDISSSASYSLLSGTTYSLTAGKSIDLSTETDFTLDALLSATLKAGTSMSLESGADMSLKFAALRLNAGSEPYVKGTQLVLFLESLLAWLSLHTHICATPGSPTSPPIPPPIGIVQPEPTMLVSTTIFGE